MDSDSILTFGLIGIGGYAIYKIFSDSGVSKTLGAVGDVAQTTAGAVNRVITGTESLFTNPQTAGYAIGQLPGNIASNYAQGQVNLATGIAKGLIDSSSQMFGTPSVDKMIIDANAKNAQPIYTNIGMTSSGALFSSAKPLVANLSTSQGAVSQIAGGQTTKSSSSIIGAKAGTMFSSGASVKSTGASGKYKTTL